jgi:hypothetical protein
LIARNAHSPRFKSRKPHLFQSAQLFRKVLTVLESHQFHHQMWVFVMNLFDRRDMMRRIVFEEEDDDRSGIDLHMSSPDERRRTPRAGVNGINGNMTGAYDSDGTINDEDD